MTSRPAIVFPVVLALAWSAAAQEADGWAAYDQPGPLAVACREFLDLTDPARDRRSVPTKVHYPEGPGPLGESHLKLNLGICLLDTGGCAVRIRSRGRVLGALPRHGLAVGVE